MIKADITLLDPALQRSLNDALTRNLNHQLTVPDLSSDRIREIYDHTNKDLLCEFSDIAARKLSTPNLAYFATSLEETEYSFSRSIPHKIAAACVLIRAIFKPSLDRENQTPFTMYKSSADAAEDMKNAGIKFYKPGEKIGFHNDGIINGNNIELAQYIAIMDLFVGYEKPGFFYWIPNSLWPELASFIEAYGQNAKALVETTPIFYESEKLLNSKSQSAFEVDLFPQIEGVPGIFMNGKILRVMSTSGAEITGAADKLQESLSRNGTRIVFPQTIGTLKVFSNSLGTHARDIMGGQVIFNGMTRLMFRSMSQKGLQVGKRFAAERRGYDAPVSDLS